MLQVTWDPLGDGEAWVEFGPDGEFGQTTPPVPDGVGESRTVLVGNKPYAEVHWRVVARQDGALVVGAEHIDQVEGIAAALPDVQLLDDDGSFEGFLFAVSWSVRTYLFALDRDADVVWYRALPLGRASLAMEQVPGVAALRYLDVSLDHTLADGHVLTEALDGTQLEDVPVEQGHHSFLTLPDGTLAWLAIDVRDDPDWGTLVGDRILTRAPDGTVRTLWSAWDHFSYDPATTYQTDFYPQGTDWTHANTLSYDATDDSLWVTLGGIDQIVEIDARTGAMLAQVGAGGAEITPAVAGYGAGYGPHGAGRTPTGSLLLFDNHCEPAASASRVLEFKLDLDGDAARLLWEYEGQPGWSSLILGDADRLETGETFIVWGDAGFLQVLDPAHTQTWLASVNGIVSDAVMVPDLYGRRPL